MAILDEKRAYDENHVPEKAVTLPAEEKLGLLALDIIIYADEMAEAYRQSDGVRFEDARASLLRNAVDIRKMSIR